MKKTRVLRLSAFLIAIFICLSLMMPAALAADETSTAENAAVTEAVSVTDEQAALAAFRAEVIRLVNVERANAGVAEVKELTDLIPLADVRAKESAASFSHTRPNGTRCFTIFGENSLKYRKAGENLAYGFKTPADVVKAWMNSEGHRKNILDANFKYIGIGYYVNENGRIYTSQLFYTPKNA